MNVIGWSSDILIARGDHMQSMLADVIAVAKRSDGMRIRMERPPSMSILDEASCGTATKAQFREGCIKAVELGMHLLPERARVLAEIHRRLDCVPESDDGSGSCQSSLAHIMDFAGAWALAARLKRAGLSVLVHEEGARSESPVINRKGRADVELLIPIGSA